LERDGGIFLIHSCLTSLLLASLPFPIPTLCAKQVLTMSLYLPTTFQ
jgi:hypothetical protein